MNLIVMTDLKRTDMEGKSCSEGCFRIKIGCFKGDCAHKNHSAFMAALSVMG